MITEPIWVPWKPHAKQRPRFAKGHAYTPAATVKAEKAIAAAYLEAGGPKLVEGPLHVAIELTNDGFWISVQQAADYENRRLRGDIDNYCKTILDSLNTVAYEDDKQIGSISITKL